MQNIVQAMIKQGKLVIDNKGLESAKVFANGKLALELGYNRKEFEVTESINGKDTPFCIDVAFDQFIEWKLPNDSEFSAFNADTPLWLIKFASENALNGVVLEDYDHNLTSALNAKGVAYSGTSLLTPELFVDSIDSIEFDMLKSPKSSKEKSTMTLDINYSSSTAWEKIKDTQLNELTGFLNNSFAPDQSAKCARITMAKDCLPLKRLRKTHVLPDPVRDALIECVGGMQAGLLQDLPIVKMANHGLPNTH